MPCQFPFPSVKADFTENSLASPRLYMMYHKAKGGLCWLSDLLERHFRRPLTAFIIQQGTRTPEEFVQMPPTEQSDST